MALVPKPAAPKVLALTQSGLASLSLDSGSAEEFLAFTSSGLGKISLSHDIELPLLAMTSGGLAKLSFAMMEEQSGDGVEALLDFSFGVEPLTDAASEVRVDFTTLMPETIHSYYTLGWVYALETFFLQQNCGWTMGVLTSRDQADAVTVSSACGVLTNGWSFPRLDYRVGQLSVAYRVMPNYFGQYVPVAVHDSVRLNYVMKADWERLDLGLKFDTGVIHQNDMALGVSNAMGQLGTTKIYVGSAYTTGVLKTQKTILEDSWAAAIIGTPKYMQTTLSYEVKSFEGVGFDTVDVHLGWSLLPTAKAVEFHLGYSQTYAATGAFNLGYARHFSTEFTTLNLHSVKERFLTRGFTMKAPFSVRAGFGFRHSLQSRVRQGAVVDSPARGSVRRGVKMPAGLSRLLSGLRVGAPISRMVRGGLRADSPFFAMARAGASLASPLRAVVCNGAVVPYHLDEHTLLTRSWGLSAPMYDFTPVVRDVPWELITDSGDILELVSGEVSIDEGNFGWAGSFELAFQEDLLLVKPNSLIYFSLGPDTYTFMVDSKVLNRTGPASFSASVKGTSPAVQLSAPRSARMTKTWDQAIMSHDLIRELLGGFPCDIQILNWAIPANRFGVSNSSPLDAVQQIAKAVGGVVESYPSGGLRIRYLFPVSVQQWNADNVDMQFIEEAEVFSTNDEYAILHRYNKFRVMDAAAASSGDKLDYTDIDSFSGEVRAYPFPWRTTAVLETTASGITIGTPTLETRDIEETIEIYNGEGNVNYPVLSVNSIEWLGTNLLGVVAGSQSTKITSTSLVDKFSLLKISYKTQCLVYPVRGAAGQSAQFLLRNP